MSNNHHAAGMAARLGAAIASIAKGAAAGGLHGAALGAVKAFLPEIVKLMGILLVVILLLPVLVFTAIPNIIFGYDNAFAQDVIDMTTKAYSVDAAYKEIKNYNQEQIDKIIEEAKAAYTDEETGPAFNETEVNAYTDNTNIYWFIAITSVAHQQNLFSMDEASIKNMLLNKLTFTSGIEERTVGEGDAATIMRTLKIDIEDLNPAKLMDKLGFSDEERNWAHVLYSSLAEDQYVGFRDSDGDGYYNTNYGDIIFTDAAINVIYYNQTDSRWGNLSYGKSGSIATSACGPTALAIVVATFINSEITPKEVAAWSVENGYRCEGNGSYHSLIPDGGAHYGMKVEGIGRDGRKLVAALEEGKLAIAIMSRGHFTSGGHFIVLRGVTSDGKILVADPASIKRSNQEWPLSLIVNEASRNAGSGGAFWILSPE